MLTSKQRAYLRSLAVNEDTILMMGKSGMSPELAKQADDALEKRELIKGRVLPESSPMTSGRPRRPSPRRRGATWSR